MVLKFETFHTSFEAAEKTRVRHLERITAEAVAAHEAEVAKKEQEAKEARDAEAKRRGEKLKARNRKR